MASYSHVFIAMSINVDLSAVKHKPCCVVAVVLLCCWKLFEAAEIAGFHAEMLFSKQQLETLSFKIEA